MSAPSIGLWTLLELAFFGPTQNDYAQRIYWETSLLHDMLSPKGLNKYDKTISSLKPPINVTPVIQIEHLETLDEKQQVMTLCGTLYLRWKDHRLSWNASNYGNIRSFSKPRHYLRGSNMEPFIPKIFATEIFARSTDLLMQEQTQVYITETGAISVAVKFTIRTTCHFSFDNFPNDEEGCSVTFYTNSPLSQVHITVFNQSAKAKGPLKRSGTGKFIYVGMWQFLGTDAETIYLLGSKKVPDPRKYDPAYIRSIGYYKLNFKRKYAFYDVKMAHPTFGISFLVLCTLLYQSIDAILIPLFLLAAEMLTFQNMRGDLPIDYDSIPAVAFIMSLTMLETLLICIWKFSYFYTKQHKDLKNISEKMELVHYYLCYIVPFHLIFNYYMIYC